MEAMLYANEIARQVLHEEPIHATRSTTQGRICGEGRRYVEYLLCPHLELL